MYVHVYMTRCRSNHYHGNRVVLVEGGENEDGPVCEEEPEGLTRGIKISDLSKVQCI